MYKTIDELFSYIQLNHEYVTKNKSAVKEIWLQAGSLGVFSCKELGFSKYLMDKLCEYDIYDFPFWLQRDVIIYLLKRFGSEAQKEKYLTDLESGCLIASLALTEAAGGSDFGNICSFFDSKNHTITGKKRFITNASFADVIFYAARNSTGTIGLWIIEPNYGMNTIPIKTILGIKGMGLSEIELNEYVVEETMLLGNIENCLMYIIKALSYERYCCAYLAFNMAKKLCHQNIEWVKKRGDLWNKQSIKNNIAEQICCIKELEICFNNIYSKFEKRGNIFIETAMLKYKSIEIALRVTQYSGLLRAGEFSSIDINPEINRMYNIVLAYAAAGGTQEIMLRIISESL